MRSSISSVCKCIRLSALMMLLAASAALAQDQAKTVPVYGIHEIPLAGPQNVTDPFGGSTCYGDFTGPDGKVVHVEGFFYAPGQWRIRFVPRQEGQWKWTANLEAAGTKQSGKGEFLCQGKAGHGFLRVAKANCLRMEYEDGVAFYPIGIQTCNFLHPDFDGPEKGKGQGQSIDTPTWLKEFSGAVNLVRTQFGQGTRAGCAFAIVPEPTTQPAGAPASAPAKPLTVLPLDWELCKKLDDTYQLHRQAGMSQILILFQDMSLWGAGGKSIFGSLRDQVNNKSIHAPNLPLQEQYIRYIVARYGCFVDIWEIFNEDGFAPDDYLAHLAEVIRKADPYKHLITTNFAHLDAPWSDIITWHEYMGMSANAVDAYLVSQINIYTKYGKPVVNTEFGNQGTLGNYDPVKYRIAVWTAYTQESSLLFWGMSFAKFTTGNPKAKGNSNAYIGADSRAHFRVFHQLVDNLPLDMRPRPIGYTDQLDIRLYSLADKDHGVIYIHHFSDHSKPYVNPDKLMMDTGPGKWKLRWVDPVTGSTVKQDEVTTTGEFLEFAMPPVTVDMVCVMERVGP